MEKTIKSGDFVRLTDPLDNGTIVRIESVDEHGFASWLGGSQYCDMEQIKANVQIGDCSYYISLSSIIGAIEQGFKTYGFNIKLYPETAVNYWKHRAEKAEAENALNEKLLDKEHNKLLDAQDYIKKVCKESSDDIQKLDAENKKLKERILLLEAELREID